MTLELHPTITFIMPIQNKEDFLIEQINTIFKLSERYPGFCEIIIVGNGTEDTALKIAWLAMKLNKIKHPYVRTKIIRYTSQLQINDLIETGINHALGQKIIIATNDPERIEREKMNGVMNIDISITRYILDANTLEEFQSNMTLM
jgi:glycosyltransferase involved in cell wall biosynthesis